jgi:AcrR family transcriptional regulator
VTTPDAPAYHHGNLRPVMIATAVDLARETGPAGVVLREVARRAGVSHNAAYRHFADREELLAEVAGVAMDRLEAAMRDRIAEVDETDPPRAAVAQLREIGRAYVGFALAETGLFTVAFAASGPHEGDGWAPPEAGPYALLNEVLDRLVTSGAVDAQRRPGAEVACWAGVHGFSELSVRGPLREVPAALRDAALENLLDVLERGLVRSGYAAR